MLTPKRILKPSRRLTVKCERCGYVSFDYNDSCPSCGFDLQVLRDKLGIYWEKPDTDFNKLFDEPPSVSTVESSTQEAESAYDDDTELDFGSDDEEFEFSLDD
ncbi:MAG: hypothetical protein QG577_2761 [Thermodesulfobacteriota bacterium]|nr:hypothetical protein [Thermodesulfobacteriota bacterium]